MNKSGFVSIVGRPSAGKSTLLNAIIGQKVSIVSDVPQTTRNNIRGIKNEKRGQMIFIDTPGMHDSDKTLNKKLKNIALQSLEEVDAILYVVDASRAPGAEEEAITSVLESARSPLFIALNKTDLVNQEPRLRDGMQEHANLITKKLPNAKVFPISALDQKGIDPLVTELFAAMPENHPWYPEEFYTDQDPDFRVAEIIREQVMNLTKEEIPHASFIEIEGMELSQKEDAEGPMPSAEDSWDLPLSQRPMLTINAVIIVERESQKGIVIGKGGSLIKEIRVGAEKQLKEIFPYKINLSLVVKVNAKWRTSEKLLQKLVH